MDRNAGNGLMGFEEHLRRATSVFPRKLNFVKEL